MTIFSAAPYNLQNGTVADATQVMANFNQIIANGNANGAANGANADITSLTTLGSGSAALPSLRFTAAASTGVYYDGTNLGFSVGGTEQAWVPAPAAATPAAIFVAGEIRAFAMSTPPTGWLEANGAAISRTTYAGLFANIGTTWGVGDGSTTFNIPDLRGTVLRAWDNGRGLDPAAPAFAAYEADSYAQHNHTLTDPGHTHTYASDGGASTAQAGGTATNLTLQGAGNTGSSTIGIAATDNSGAAETRAKSSVILYCIKT